jgi:hypothetical protein
MRRYLEAGFPDRLLTNMQHRASLTGGGRFGEAAGDMFFVFSVSHLMPAFVVLLVGTVLSSVVFIVELIVNCLWKRREKEMNRCVRRVRKLYWSLISHFRYRLMLHLAVTLHVFWSTMNVCMYVCVMCLCMYACIAYFVCIMYVYMYVRGGADESLAGPGRKQATATKDGIYSAYSPRSSIHFLARCSNFSKPLKKIQKFARPNTSPLQQ